MITIPFNHKERSDSIYLMFKQNLLPSSASGSVLSLPLIFEVRASLEHYKLNQRLHHYFDIIDYKTAISLLYSHSTLQGRLKVYPVLTTNKILYLSQFLPYYACDLYSFESSELTENLIIQLPVIQLKSIESSNFDIKLSDFVNFDVYNNTPGKFHAIPSVEHYKFEDHLKTQIYTRYFTPNYPISVLDSKLPFIALSKFPNKKDSPLYYAISPLTADLLGIKRIPLRTILEKILEINLQDLATTIQQVKANNLTILFAGTGGTGINTICWLSEICELLGFDNIFKEVHIFEKDKVDFSNIFRFPLPYSTYKCSSIETKKVDLIKDKISTLTQATFYHDKFITCLEDIPSLLLDNNTIKSNHVIYGAPSVANRNFLSSLGAFVSATHADNTASLYINPIADDFLQVETYGLIQLNSFFMNQILMAIGFLHILASKSYNLSNQHFADFTFTADIKKGFKFGIETEMLAIPTGGAFELTF